MSERLPIWSKFVGTRETASCMETARQLQAYLDGDLDQVTARRLARHLELCRRCGLEEATYLAIKASLARRGAQTVDQETIDRLYAFGTELLESDGPTPSEAG